MNEQEKKHLATCCPKTAAGPAVAQFGFGDIIALMGLVQKYGPAIATLVQSLLADAGVKTS